jgi:hypothetical protein
MKKILPLLVCITVLAFSQPLATAAKPQRTVSVNGTADVMLAPDVCVMTVVVNVARQPDAATAYATVKAQTKKLLEALKAKSVTAKDIESQGIVMKADYGSPNRSKVTFYDDYTVTQTLQVKIRDVDNMPAVFDAVLGTDAKVQSVNYVTENEEQAYAKPRIDAINEAKARAAAICQATGLTLLKPISVSEHTGEDWGPGRYDMSQASQQGGIQLEPRARKVNLSVSVVYEVE